MREASGSPTPDPNRVGPAMSPVGTFLPARKRQQLLGGKERPRAQEKRHGELPSPLSLNLGHEIRRGNVEGAPAGESEAMGRQRCYPAGDEDPGHRRKSEQRGAADRLPGPTSAGYLQAGNRDSLRQLVQNDGG